MVIITFTINGEDIQSNRHKHVYRLSLLLIKYKGKEWYQSSSQKFIKDLCCLSSYFRQPVRYFRKILSLGYLNTRHDKITHKTLASIFHTLRIAKECDIDLVCTYPNLETDIEPLSLIDSLLVLEGFTGKLIFDTTQNRCLGGRGRK